MTKAGCPHMCIVVWHTAMAFKSCNCFQSNSRDKTKAGLGPWKKVHTLGSGANGAGPGVQPPSLCVKLTEVRAGGGEGSSLTWVSGISWPSAHVTRREQERDGRQTIAMHRKQTPCQEQQTQYCACDGDSSRKQNLIQFLRN